MSKEEKTQAFKPTRAQELATSFSGADLLVSAGAGSGKTTTLANRIAQRLADGEDILRKLVVTYTNDAANELRAKISTALSKMLASDKKTERLEEQLVYLGGADICTIDAFCLKIVRENFEKLGIDGGFRMADESEIEVLCRDAMSEIIDTLYEEKGDDEGFLSVCECFGTFSGEERLKDDLLSLYKSLLTTRLGIKTLLEAKELRGDFIDTPYGRVIKEHALLICRHYIEFFERALEEIQENDEAVSAYSVAFSTDRDFARELEATLRGGNYEQIGAQISSYAPASLGKTTAVEKIDVKSFNDTRNAFKKAIRTELSGLFSIPKDQLEWVYEQNERLCRAIYEVLVLFDNEYSKKKRSAGVCDFNDISHYAMRLLYEDNGEISPLAGEIAQRYDEVYVDEYQDTNYIQDRIFYAISHGNRFLVGDIKQSIYAFRSADPSIFSSYRRGFTPLPVEEGTIAPTVSELKKSPDFKGAQIAMSENFRCDRSIIDFSNAVSNHMFLNSHSIPYDKSDELKFKKLGCDYEPDTPEVYLIDKSVEPDCEDEEALSAEADFVARRIQELLDGETLANGKKIKPKDITILLRSFSRPVAIYRSALAKRGISSVYRGDEHFFEKSEILLTLCVLNAIDNPMRDVYLAGAMRSCVFGFSLEELAVIRSKTRKEDSLYSSLRAYNDEDELGKRVSEFLLRLQKYREECRRLSCCEALSLIYADTPLMTSASESERKSLLKLYSIARSYEAGKNKGIYGFLRYIEGIKEGSGKEMLGDDEENSVRLMSLHASKGLEFEVCFLSSCGAQINAKDASKDIIFVKDLGINTYVYRPGGLVRYNTILRKIAQIAKKRETIEEEMRMLYVAMTRARSRLIITGALAEPEKFLEARGGARASEYSTLNPKCYLDWILHAVADTPLAKIEICDKERIYGELKPTEHEDDKKDEQAPRDEEKSKEKRTRQRHEESLEALRAELKARAEFEYPYEHLRALPSKLAISRLSATVLDEELDDDDSFELDDLPSFVSQDDSASPAEIGTATHTFMQFCDFDRLEAVEDILEEINRLKTAGFLSPRASALVDPEKIRLFRESEIFEMIKGASEEPLREFRFNIMVPTEGLYKTSRLEGQEVLVQGICDIIFKLGDELILVDYKTDDVTEENYKQRLARSHSFQLKYYKIAVEKMFKPKRIRTIIYSIKLGKHIEL